MSPEWAAGLFEGEGYIRQFNPRYGTYSVVVKMTDLDVLERLNDMYGGKIYTERSIPNRKPIWTWTITRKAGVKNFLLSIFPFLLERRSYLASNLLDDIDAR